MFTSLSQAKDFVIFNKKEGCTCPACDQFVKEYSRKLNSGMAVTLIRLVRKRGRKWVNVKEFLRAHKYTNSHDWTWLRHWGLLEEAKHDKNDTSQRTSGVWIVTENGHTFVTNTMSLVMSHANTYNNKFIGLTGKWINIKDCLGNKFDYQELMNE